MTWRKIASILALWALCLAPFIVAAIYYLWLDVTPLLREIVHKVGPVANGREADAVVLRGRVLVWDMKKDEPSNVNELLPDAIKPPTISLAHRLPKEVSFTFS